MAKVFEGERSARGGAALPLGSRRARAAAAHGGSRSAGSANRLVLTPLAILAGMSGNLMEWYDFGLYGVLASTLGALFFPHAGRLLALLSVFGVFAAGYVMRIVGGAAFGHIGDRFGRRRALLLSAATMAIATSLVGCLPTYAAVGIASPILFTLFRLLQGLSIGGEFTASISYLIENAPPGRRALQGSFAPFTAGIGLLLGAAMGNVLFGLFTPEQVLAGAWRIPFLLSVPLGVSLAILRSVLPEDGPAAGAAASRGPSPVATVLREHPVAILRGALLGWGPNSSFYAVAVFLGSFLISEHLLPEPRALGLQTATIALMVALTPVAGHLADRFGRRRMVLVGLTACAVLVWPMLAILHNQDPSDDLVGACAFGAAVTIALTSYQVWIAESFPRALRGSGVGVAYNGAAGILGGATPLICATLVELTGNPLAPAFWVGLGALVSLAIAYGQRETGDAPLT